jgi:hypothetical protein
MQRVLDRANVVVLVKQPRPALIDSPARMALDLDEEQPGQGVAGQRRRVVQQHGTGHCTDVFVQPFPDRVE